jgi:hypothetical protein
VTDADSGALFAASDGIDLFDDRGLEVNTAPLGGNVSTSQAVAFIGQPGQASDFYLITNAASSFETTSAGLFWSPLPCGHLAAANTPTLIPGTELFTEALATIRNANGVDRWVLSVATTGVAVIPVTSAGFGSPAITPWGGVIPDLTTMQRAFIVFARDRRTFALTAENVGLVMGEFDSASGAVSGLVSLPVPSLFDLYTAAFSPDGTKVYASSWAGDYYQIDLGALDAGVDDGGVATLGPSGGALRLAVDDRIYVASYASSTLGVVTNPNAPAAQLVITSATLPAGCESSYGFPGLEDL